MSRFEKELSWCVCVLFFVEKNFSFMVRHAFLGSVKEENFGAGKSGCGLNSGVFLGPYHMARFWMKLLKQTSE